MLDVAGDPPPTNSLFWGWESITLALTSVLASLFWLFRKLRGHPDPATDERS